MLRSRSSARATLLLLAVAALSSTVFVLRAASDVLWPAAAVDAMAIGWRAAMTGSFVANMDENALFKWRQPAVDIVSPLPPQCICAPPLGALPPLKPTSKMGDSYVPISRDNPYFKDPAASTEKIIAFNCDLIGEQMQTIGLNGVLAAVPFEFGPWHGIGACAMQACIDNLKGCQPRWITEIGASHPLMPAHGGGGSPPIHGSLSKGVESILFQVTDADVWERFVRGMFCPWEVMSPTLILDCLHGVGHGALARVMNPRGGEAWSQDSLSALKRAAALCEAAPTRALGYDCAIGLYMGGADAGIYHTDETLEAHGWAWPCGKEGLPFSGACFENIFIKLHLNGKQSVIDDADCEDSQHVDDASRLGCVYALANYRFPWYDGFYSRSNMSSGGGCSIAKDPRSMLDFVQGSGYDHGKLIVAEGSELCGDLPGECVGGGLPLPAPSTLRTFCEEMVGHVWVLPTCDQTADDDDEKKKKKPDDGHGHSYDDDEYRHIMPRQPCPVSERSRLLWLSCVAGASSNGLNVNLDGGTNIGTIVDMYDLPPHIVRRFCHQLRLSSTANPAVRMVGEEAAKLCEESALFYGTTSEIGWEDYHSNWPLEIIDQPVTGR